MIDEKLIRKTYELFQVISISFGELPRSKTEKM